VVKSLGPAPPEIHEYYKNIPLRDNTPSQLKIFHNTERPNGPLFVLAFGGGFAHGTNEQLTPFSRALVRLFGGTAVNVSYRVAPEHKWPTAHHDVWDSLLWCAENAKSIEADPAQGFILGGISAGANITLVLSHEAQKSGLDPPLTGLWECVPLTFRKLEHVPEKYRELWFANEQNVEVPVLDKESVDLYHEFAEPDLDSEWYTPYAIRDVSFRGQPKTYISVDGMDPLRDDGLIHEKILREQGVETRIDVW